MRSPIMNALVGGSIQRIASTGTMLRTRNARTNATTRRSRRLKNERWLATMVTVAAGWNYRARSGLRQTSGRIFVRNFGDRFDGDRLDRYVLVAALVAGL